jgi:RES domain
LTSHPEPPDDFASVRLMIRRFTRTWWRIHRTEHDPIYFGRTGQNRFDAPAEEFGVLYVGADTHCSFIETFGHATGVRFVTEAELRARALSTVVASRPLRLVDMRSNGLARMGADSALTSGLDYGVAQRWALAIHRHPRQPDGLLCRARHDPKRLSAAIFDRAASVVSAKRVGSLMDAQHTPLLADILDTYRFGLVGNV